MIKPQLEEFMRRMAPKSVAIIPGAREATRSNDTHYRFRQDSDFFYLTGFEEPEAIAVVKPSEDDKYTLFVRPRDPEREIWDGRRAGVEGAMSEFGAHAAFPISEFNAKLREILTTLTFFITASALTANSTTRSFVNLRRCADGTATDSSAANDRRRGVDRSRDARDEERRRTRDHANRRGHRRKRTSKR